MEIVLSKFVFEGPILTAFLALYPCPSAQVYTSGLFHTLQHIQWVSQGCNLSPTILNLMIEPLAETIRSHTSIKVFQFGSNRHVINLFEDDVILLLTNPLASLAQAHNILMDFGYISYYKVNFTKSLILSMGVQQPTQNTLQESLPCTRRKKGILYLGITLTNTTSSLADDNIRPFIVKLETQLIEISSKELSWLGKIVAFKIYILLQTLYRFQTLPILIPTNSIQTMLSLMWKYIWGGKKARCS